MQLQGSTVGERVKELRLLRALGLRDLAKASGMTPSQLWKIESNVIEKPRERNIKKIADALNVPGSFLSGTHPDLDQARKIEVELRGVAIDYGRSDSDYMESDDLQATDVGRFIKETSRIILELADPDIKLINDEFKLQLPYTFYLGQPKGKKKYNHRPQEVRLSKAIAEELSKRSPQARTGWLRKIILDYLERGH